MQSTALQIKPNPERDVAVRTANNDIIQRIINSTPERIIEYFRTSPTFDPGTLLIHLARLPLDVLEALCSQYPATTTTNRWNIPEGWHEIRYSILVTLLYAFHHEKHNVIANDIQGYPFAPVQLREPIVQ